MAYERIRYCGQILDVNYDPIPAEEETGATRYINIYSIVVDGEEVIDEYDEDAINEIEKELIDLIDD